MSCFVHLIVDLSPIYQGVLLVLLAGRLGWWLSLAFSVRSWYCLGPVAFRVAKVEEVSYFGELGIVHRHVHDGVQELITGPDMR